MATGGGPVWANPRQTAPQKSDPSQAGAPNQSDNESRKETEKKGATQASAPATIPGTRFGPTLTILTPIEGVDFNGYVNGFLKAIREKWYAKMPESAREGEKGKVTVLFNIQYDGKVADEPTIESSSGKDAFDQAALTAIREASPFDPLPEAFHGPYIRLRIIFLYNLPVDAAQK
jgi:TonB family protein